MLATDGVGEGPSAMKYARTAAEMWDKKMSAQKIADQLTRKAEKTRFADNTTILIVCIKGSTEQ
jgi:serine/threonine protein phosphatase PrpC